MPHNPRFRYFLSQENHPISENRAQWTDAIPLHKGNERKIHPKTEDAFLSYGDYFLAVRSFLEQDDCHALLSAISEQLNRKIKKEELQDIRIFLEKHGEFYHPSRIETPIAGKKISFVLNVAVSETGRQYVDNEVRLLQRLNAETPLSFIPRIYAQGEIRSTASPGSWIRMFLGEWFSGYHEFHLSRDPMDGKTKIIVWDTEQGSYFLSNRETIALYTEVAKILTWYYNVETFEQIFPWHHAAGDFIVKPWDKKIDLKLITVRQYASMFMQNDEGQDSNRNTELMLDALRIFFLNLSIRMRLDRIEGVRDVVWSDDTAIEGTIKGFFLGLSLKRANGIISDSQIGRIKTDFLSMPKDEMSEMSKVIIETYSPGAVDDAITKQKLNEHVEALYQALRKKH